MDDDAESEVVHGAGSNTSGNGGPRGSFLSKLSKLTRRLVVSFLIQILV